MKESDCSRAIMVAHNATFDHSFTMTAAERAGLKRNPFHPFVTFDTAALAGWRWARRCCRKPVSPAGMPFDGAQAHSALDDTEQTAQLFCEIREPLEASGRLAAARSHPGVIKKRLQRSRFFTDGGNYSAFGSSVWYFAAVSLISCCSSPRWYISMTISQPPTSSPSTHSCGKSASWRI